MNEKISFQQLSELLSEITGSTIATSELFIKEFCSIISETLVNGESVKIKNIGTFSPSGLLDKPILFEPDENLADAINMPFACFDAVELRDDISEEILNECDNEMTEQHKTDSIIVSEVMIDAEQENEKQVQEEDSINEELEHSENIEDDNESNIIVSENEETIKNNKSEDIEKEDLSFEIINTNAPKSLLWLWILISIIIGFIIGYCVGNIYPYQQEMIATVNELVSISPVEDVEIDSLEVKTDAKQTINITTDTVGRTRFLTTMARKYYGEMLFWVYIYEENKGILGNPNRIKPGTIVIIPEAEKYGIDKNDSVCIEKAKLKAIEIYAPYQK